MLPLWERPEVIPPLPQAPVQDVPAAVSSLDAVSGQGYVGSAPDGAIPTVIETQEAQDDRPEPRPEPGGLGQLEGGGAGGHAHGSQSQPDRGREGGVQADRIQISDSSEPFTYRIVEGSEVTASHDPLADFDRRADYPFENERAYHRVPREQDKVVETALDLNPALLLDAPTGMDGAPVVDGGLNVLGGNSRAMSIQLAYGRNLPALAGTGTPFSARQGREAC